MRNQNRATRVETRGSLPADDAHEQSRVIDPRLQQFGRDFDKMFREAVRTLADRCTFVPTARRQAIYDMVRPEVRSLSVEVLGQNIAACVFDPSLGVTALEEFSTTVECWLRAQLVTSVFSIRTESQAETRQQADQDVDQMEVVDAVERGDHATVMRARQSLIKYLACGKRLLVAITQADIRMRLTVRHERAH